MRKSIVAAIVIFAILLTGSLAPCMAAPLVSQTGESETASAAPPVMASDAHAMDDAVVGELVQGVTNTQLVVIGLAATLLVVAIIAVA
ncbi:MAG: hypothetical protein Kow0099_11810 [Candidatus Abyssubacteria bacterium]